MRLEPLDDRVVVEPKEGEKETPGGILLPETARQQTNRGKVLATGPGKPLEDGGRQHMALHVGDLVVYSHYAGSDVELDGRKLKVLHESEVLARVLKGDS